MGHQCAQPQRQFCAWPLVNSVDFPSLYSCVTLQGAEGAEGCVGAEWLLPGAQMVGEQATLGSHTGDFVLVFSPFLFFQTIVLNWE